jgi:hypothetical protein
LKGICFGEIGTTRGLGSCYRCSDRKNEDAGIGMTDAKDGVKG